MTSGIRRSFAAFGLVALLIPARSYSSNADWQRKVDPHVLEAATQGVTEFLVVLHEQADLTQASSLHTKLEKGAYVFQRLREVAERTQEPLLEILKREAHASRAFWAVNMIWVRADAGVVRLMAERQDVARIDQDFRLDRAELLLDPQGDPQRNVASGVEWNVSQVNGPAVWFEGVRGAGAVVGSMDTGFDWQHPALINSYRGWQRLTADHNYNWHDAIHADRGPCGPDSPEPCDSESHGTLTMGTTVGDDGGSNQIGLAPEASWIGCRCWEPIRRTFLSYVSECFQWFIAPTDLNDENPDPAEAPHVINNSWICDFDEGCSDPNVLKNLVENVRAAGIVVVGSAGNSGPFCSTIEWPPAIYSSTLTVGATTRVETIADFSSRGPILADGSGRLKPEIVAPGENVRSSIPGGGYEANVSGTSLSGPLVVGTVALLISAVPELAGQVETLEQILIESAVPRTSQENCGDVPGSEVPNNTFGYGRLDAYAAYRRALEYATTIDDPVEPPDSSQALLFRFRLLPNSPNPFNPGTMIEYELATPARVRLRIFDVAGRVVRELLRDVQHEAGRHSVAWNGRDAEGQAVPSGIYFCRLDAGPRAIQTIRMTLLR